MLPHREGLVKGFDEGERMCYTSAEQKAEQKQKDGSGGQRRATSFSVSRTRELLADK
jgi:hypothetical protein